MRADRVKFWIVREKTFQRCIESEYITDRECIIDIYEDWFEDGGGIEYEDDAELYEGVIAYGKENSNPYFTSIVDRLLDMVL